jgi:beta-glucosidase-like glycosyl hydrolase/CubicO group peptidase (beta-lactamase class C family)
MKYVKQAIGIILFLCIIASASSQHQSVRHKTKVKKVDAVATVNKQLMTNWVDSVMNTFTLDDKVGQLMIVRVPSKMNAKQLKEFSKLIQDYRVGGLCFFGGKCADQLALTQRFQRQSHFPLFVSIDAEWGLGMRLTDAYSFSRQMMFGALPPMSDSLITLMGTEVALQCKKMGIHINFAPVVDLNSNPNNPVIGVRSFGEDRTRVAEKGILYARALQNNGVMAVAKHFPGHGDTETDSHIGLPTIDHKKAYLDSVDLYPFKRLVAAGVHGVMVGHLHVECCDKNNRLPGTLSEKVTNELLRKQLGFSGLIITDGMDMGAIVKNYKDGTAELEALLAGADVLLLPSDVSKAIERIKNRALRDKEFAELVDLKCRGVLREKYRCGLHKMDVSQLSVPSKEDFNRCEALTESVAMKAATLVKNDNNVLPILQDEKVCCVHVGLGDSSVSVINNNLASRLGNADKVIVSLHARVSAGSQKNYGITSEMLDLVKQICSFNPKTVLVIYGPPYILKYFPLEKTLKSDEMIAGAPPRKLQPAAIVVAYQDREAVYKGVTQLLCSGGRCVGRLPVTVGNYKVGTFVKTLKEKPYDPYARVKQAGMDASCFAKIDSIANMGIAKKAYPGCQVLVAKGGKVVYHKAYGRQTYDEHSAPIDTNTIYDLASLTKVTATTFAVMKLVDSKKIDLDDPLSRYLPYLKHSNKKSITVRQALSHIARLKAFDAYYKKVAPECGDMSVTDIVDANHTMSCSECRQAILEQVAKSELTKEKNKYLYSDLGFMLLSDVVRVVSGQTLDIFMQQQFYQPMGLKNTTFCPRLHGFDTSRIAPTENDTYYRHRLLRGEVHDQNAAAMGGVSGHAGLFSTASDIAKLYFMMLNNGTYNGRRYLSQEVINTFNQRYYADKGNRRALGFDKPLMQNKSSHCAPEASQSSFGHTGFTGTMVWVDPQYDLIYIFLSNRVYPDASNNKLAQMNIRTDIQSLIYKSIDK